MIEQLISFSLRNRVLVLLVAAGLLVWGAFSVRASKLDAIPDLSENQVIVFTEWVPDKPALLTIRPGLMASLNALNNRYGRGTVKIATAVAPARGAGQPWEGKAQWRSPAFTTRLEDLLVVT
jgi:hypothetical protein